MPQHQDMTPVPKDYDEGDQIESLISEFQQLEALHYKGYNFHIQSFRFNTGDALEEHLDVLKSILIAKEPSNRTLRVITLRCG